ncbi:MAG: nuclease [Acidobacteria bacterium]|nr:nuclease [Acidobacteriota bacterium]
MWLRNSECVPPNYLLNRKGLILMSLRTTFTTIRLKIAITCAFIAIAALIMPSGNFLNRITVRTVLADTTPQTLPFTQNWTNTGLITTDDTWTGVPGIIGYRGDDATAGTGVDPQTITQDLSGVIDVNANRSDPNTFTTGGISEFDGIANPVVAFQGSGTADFPNLVISLNTSGQTGINVGYNLRDIDGSADNATQAVALQYRVGASGAYTNLPAGFVADATTGPSLATLVTPVSVTLPAACDNQPIVQVRIITSNAGGTDEWVGVDDINITAGGGGGGTTLSINDVTQAETNSGTTNFTFTVSLTAAAGAGGVTFDATTADGTTNPANAGTDYVALTNQPFSIAQGNSSTNVTVQVNGDPTPEPNETFFVNISNVVGANNGDLQGLGTITNDDFSLTPIHTIQGSGASSPFVATSVTTSGIVTGLRSNGFFLQEPDASVDGDPNTSEGIFVFTSSAPPAGAALGNNVQVAGTVAEFVPASDPGTQSQTEMTSPTVTVNSTGNALPAPITITAADTLVNNVNNLEKFEGMRVHVNSLTVGAPTGGNIDEVNATSASFGDFYGVITGVARPFREPGIEIPYPTPTPYPSGAAPASAPTFDANPERLRVNSLGLTGSVDLQVASNAVVTGITGPLDFGFRTYTIDTDPPSVTATPLVTGGITATAVPVPNARELTIGSFNMQRFFDTTDDPAVSDVVLTTTAFNNRLNKASLAIRNIMSLPDVIGVEEMENLTTLQTVATKLNNDEVAAARPNPNYQAYLVEGNDIGGIDVGFLVKAARVTVFSVTQYNKTETFIDPSTGSPGTLNDRPPLVLRASIVQPDGTTLFFSVIVNHLRSLGSVTLQTNAGAHTRVKRNLEAASLAKLINTMQNGGGPEQVLPYDQNIVSVGDYNSFQFNDGYDDVMGVVKGTPAPATQVVESSADLNNPDLTDLIDTLPADQKYSYTFGGNAQALDHTVANQNMMNRFSRFAYARMDADFPDSLRNDPNRPERISDHDPEVSYFNMGIVPTAANGVVNGRIAGTDGQPVSGAVVTMSGAMSRKTITDTNGNYHFDNVEANGFYTVTPSRANYTFSPANRSFSLVGGRTEAAFTASSTGDAANPLEVAEYFVRQQYMDLLGREPDEGGFNYWSDQINQCGNDSNCTGARRRDVAAAFFIEQEFQLTGSFIYGLYKGALGRRPVFLEYSSDHQQVVGGANLEARKQAFAEAFVRRADFVQKYQANTSAESFVDAMVRNLRDSSGVDLSSQRDVLLRRYNSGASADQSRSFVVRDLTESVSFRQAEYNAAFVLSEYFGYLHRNADAGGYEFWVNVLNNGDTANYRGMVCAFITSAEYQRRFSSVISRGDGECSR